MNDVELFWATICVPFENYQRRQRVRLPRSRRNAGLQVEGYLWFDVTNLMGEDDGQGQHQPDQV